MSFCKKCDRPCTDPLCASCIEAIELGDGGVDSDGQACYNDRLSAGFALLTADERPGNYNAHWS